MRKNKEEDKNCFVRGFNSISNCIDSL